jgi:hypothetical protein
LVVLVGTCSYLPFVGFLREHGECASLAQKPVPLNGPRSVTEGIWRRFICQAAPVMPAPSYNNTIL